MHLHTAGVLDLLTAKTGRYIENHHGHYVMKEGRPRRVIWSTKTHGGIHREIDYLNSQRRVGLMALATSRCPVD